jgi:hypothetical protein
LVEVGGLGAVAAEVEVSDKVDAEDGVERLQLYLLRKEMMLRVKGLSD